jgi:hypothetical protein
MAQATVSRVMARWKVRPTTLGICTKQTTVLVLATLAAPLSWGTQQNPAIEVYRATVGDNLIAALNKHTQTVTWSATTTSPLDASYTLWVTNGTVNTSQANGAIY